MSLREKISSPDYRRGWAEGYKAAKDSLQAILRGEYSRGYRDGMEDEQQAHAEADTSLATLRWTT